METIYVLIMMAYLVGDPDGHHVAVAEFTTKERCEKAKVFFNARARNGFFSRSDAECFEK